jgi:hypothetical protein
VWAAILEKYDTGDDSWRTLVSNFEPLVIESVLVEPPDVLQALIAFPLRFILNGWRDFAVDVHISVRGRLDPDYARQIYDLDVPSFFHRPRVGRATLAKSAFSAAEGAQAAFEANEPNQALSALHYAIHLLNLANWPTDRWYLNAPAFVFDTLIVVHIALTFDITARFYARIALVARPDNPRLYAVLPTLAERIGASATARQCEDIARQAEGGGDPRALARRAVALLSFTGIALTETGQMTDEKMASLQARGIEDLHTPINLPVGILPILPWLTEDDYDFAA